MTDRIRQFPVRFYGFGVAVLQLAFVALAEAGISVSTTLQAAITGVFAAGLSFYAEKFTVPNDKYEALRQHPSSGEDVRWL